MYIKKHKIYFKILFIYFIIFIGTFIFSKFFSLSQDEKKIYRSRKILQLNYCTPRSVEEFPEDFMTRKDRVGGGVIFHIAASIYLFMALAIICDEYFVSSLERLCEVLNLKHDVAGATFMAAGSSAPELCTSLIGVFITNSDVGVSTIVGSAVFNVLCIIAICGIFSGTVIYLTWWPMVRDCVVYCISIIVLIIVLSDNIVQWFEALIMVILYALYILVMYHNDRIHSFVSGCLPISKTPSEEYNALLNRQVSNSFGPMESSEEEDLMETGDVETFHSRIVLDEDMTNLECESTSTFEIPDSFCKRLYWVAMLPVTVLCYFTIPDCRRPGCWRKLFFLTFIMSVVWIALTTYILVWMVCITGDTFGIPDTIMGLTILAAGTSIPDALAGFIVARNGFGDMAISNSIGSNIFDILICLGIPWIIQTGFLRPGSVIGIASSGLMYTSITLLSTVALMVGTVMISKWKLSKLLGFVFLLFYIIIITFSCLYEVDVFGKFSLPPCARTRDL